MVLRNPYGYLIKHFKLIHLILLGIYIYLVVHVNSILNYYKQFAAGAADRVDAISYINSFYLFFIIVSIAICVIVYALMRYKKKPRLLYLLLIGFYVIVGVVINISYGGLDAIYFSTNDTKTVLLYRDILQIMIWAQYVSLAFVLVRALGFDVKKFNFVKDLNELNLSEADIEEIEVTLGGTESVQRRFNRRLRELRYYYLENKIFIIIVAAVLIFMALSGFFVHREIVAKVYKEGEYFSLDNCGFRVVNSYITSLDWKGEPFASNSTTFVIIRLNVTSSKYNDKLNTGNFVLKAGDNSYTSDTRYANRFTDLGTVYKGNAIAGSGSYLFIFNISIDDVNKKMVLEYAGSRRVSLSPVKMEEVGKAIEYKVTEKLDLSKSSLRSGYFTISSYEINDSFNYSYQYEVLGQTNTASLTISNNKGSVLHLIIDANLPYSLDKYSFLKNFGSLKYKVGNEEKIMAFSDKTPGSYTKGLYLAVDKSLVNAESIWIELSIRDKKYKYILK